jgi:hypothetical protein
MEDSSTICVPSTTRYRVLGTGTKNTELDWLLTPIWRESWKHDGGVEHNWMQTLPQRPQQGHWEFLFKTKKNISIYLKGM